MSVKGYKGNSNKGIWENGRFNKGMRFTNEPLREGSVKIISNFDISRTGGSLRPRMPYFNSAFTFESGAPFGLGKNTIKIQPYQDSAKDYFIDIGSFRRENIIIDMGTIDEIGLSVYDGDTIYMNNRPYRLLGIDAPEMDDAPYGNDSKVVLQNIINSYPGDAQVRIIYDKNSNSQIDSYGRPLVWVELITQGKLYNKDWEELPSIPLPNPSVIYFPNRFMRPEPQAYPVNTKGIQTGFYMKPATSYDYTNGVTIFIDQEGFGYQEFARALHAEMQQHWSDQLLMHQVGLWETPVVRVNMLGLYYLYVELYTSNHGDDRPEEYEMTGYEIAPISQSYGAPETINLSVEMLFKGRAFIFGETEEGIEEVVLPKYDHLHSSSLIDAREYANLQERGFNRTEYGNIKYPFALQDVGPHINIYSKPSNTVFEAYQQDSEYLKTPSITLASEVLIDSSQVNIDLEVPIQAALTIKFKEQYSEKDFETHTLSNRRLPYIKMAYSELDGILFLGEVYYNGDLIYEGMISVNYFIPLDEQHELHPQFDKAYFKIETYKNNVFEIEVQDLGRYSTNLLDREEVRIVSQYGEDAMEANKIFPMIKTVLIKNNKNKFVSELEFGNEYEVVPILNLPTLDERNGYEDYSDYAIKFDIFEVNRNTPESEFPIISTRWTQLIERDFTVKKKWGYGGPEDSSANIRFNNLDDSFKISMGDIPIGSIQITHPGTQFIKNNFVEAVQTTPILSGEASIAFIDDPSPIIYFGAELPQDGAAEIPVLTDGDILLTPKKGYPTKPSFDFLWGDAPVLEQKIIDGESRWVHGLNPLGFSQPDYGFYYKHFFKGITREVPLEIYNNLNSHLAIGTHLPEEFKQMAPGTYITFYPVDELGKRISFLSKTYWKQVQEWWRWDVETVEPNNIDVISHLEAYLKSREDMFHYTRTKNMIEIGVDYGSRVDKHYMEVHYAVSSLKNTQTELFGDSKHGIQVRVYLAPVKSFSIDGYPEDDENELNSIAQQFTMQAMLYESKERELKQIAYGERLSHVTDIGYFNNRIVLYGEPKGKNILYLSNPNNPTYFPLKYALDQFDSPIVHVHPYGEQLIVFTVSDIYIVFNVPEETESGGLEDVYYAKKIINNISIETFLKDTVVTIGKYVVFMAGTNLYLLKPNIYVEDPTDLILVPIADAIAELLYNPTSFIVRRHQFYGTTADIFNSNFKPNIEIKMYAVNNTISLFMSTYLPELDLVDDSLFMVEIQHDIDTGLWKVYDTKSCAYPGDMSILDSVEGPHYIMRNHPTVDKGGTLMAKTGLNLWDFDEGYGRIFDIKPIKFIEGTAVYNTARVDDPQESRNRVKYPIYPYISSGNMYVSPHLNKRFHQVHIDVTNIDCLELPVSLDFGVDGHLRQNSRSASIIQVINEGVNLMTEYHDTEMSEGLSFDTWGLDVSRFGPLQMLRVKFGVSGRGRLPTVEIGFKTTGMFEFYKYSVIYKEQTVR